LISVIVLAIILNIETATAVCSVAVGIDGEVRGLKEEHKERSHASQLNVFIEQLLDELAIPLNEIDAVSVSKGPGSYTGLRIGASTAKGLCYSLGKPLIAIDTLKSIAARGVKKLLNGALSFCPDDIKQVHFCPMIDARRMEVYAAIYDINLNVVRDVQADIVDESTYSAFLQKRSVVFLGDGMEKCKEAIGTHEGQIFLDGIMPSAEAMVALSEKKFQNKEFENTAYFEPYYLKDFIAGPKGK
jgi:tRNA threonylcarbamoyladenosine biosynthesis protein TsaB